jgi:hypothetical protein
VCVELRGFFLVGLAAFVTTPCVYVAGKPRDQVLHQRIWVRARGDVEVWRPSEALVSQMFGLF